MRITLVTLLFAGIALGQETPQSASIPKIPANSKLYMTGIEFEADYRKAFIDEKVPVVIVASKEEADFIVRTEVQLQMGKHTSYAWHAPTPSADGKLTIVTAAGAFAFYCHSEKRNAGKGGLDVALPCAKQLREHIAQN